MPGTIFSIERGPEDELIFRFKRPRFRLMPEARGHLREASKETLLAFRSLIDEAISSIERREEREGKKTKIEVE